MTQFYKGRVKHRSSSVAGTEPTIPVSDNPYEWSETDIHDREFYINTADDRLFIRSDDRILPISTGIQYRSSGVYDMGSGITITSGSTFDLSYVKGVVIDDAAEYPKSVAYEVSYPGGTGLTSPYIGSSPQSYVMIDRTGTVVFSPTAPTAIQRRENLVIGAITHGAGSFVSRVNSVDFLQNALAQHRDLTRAIGIVNVGIVPSVYTGLQFQTSGGYLCWTGINYVTDKHNPSRKAFAGATPTSFIYRTQTGSGGGLVNTVDPTNYDSAGTITLIGGSALVATNQRIYATLNGTFVLQYGQVVYANLAAAITAAQQELFNTYPPLVDGAILVGILSIKKTATDVTDSTQAVLLRTSKFGETTGAAGGMSVTSLQQAYDNSVTPEIVTDVTRGALTLKRGTAADTDNVLEIQNGSGSVTASILGNGYLGIGITPTAPLHVFSAATLSPIFVSNDSVNLILNSDSDANSSSDTWITFKDRSSYKWSFGYDKSLTGMSLHTGSALGATPSLFVNDSGNVGLTTSAPWEKLSIPYNYKLSFGAATLYNFNVYKSSAGSLHTYFDSRDDNANCSLFFRMRTGGTPIDAFTILGSGNVGVGTAAPGYKLDVNGVTNTTDVRTLRLYPPTDSTTGIQIRKADGTTVVATFDTTNSYVGIGVNPNNLLQIGSTNICSTGANEVTLGKQATVYYRAGQASINNLFMGWQYNASAASAYAEIGTYGYSNNLKIDAATVMINSASGGATKIGDVSNYTNFDANGHMTMVGTATTFRDETNDAINLQQTGSGVSINSSENVVEYTTGANTLDYMYVNIQLNHDRKLTSTIVPHIHFFQAENNMPNFLIQYRWQINGGAKVTSWTNLKCNTAVFSYSSGTIHQIANSAGISAPVGSTISDIVQFRVIRDTGNTSGLFTGADPYSTTVGVLQFDIHMECDSMGSNSEYSK